MVRMTITAYRITDNNNVVDKVTGTAIASAVVRPTAAVDMHNPAFVVDVNNALYTCNYLYCDTFQRWYYINNISVSAGQTMTLHCTVDVLKSFATEIKALRATVVRSESAGAPTYIPDSQLPINPVVVDTESIKFAAIPFIGDGNSYILTTLGGGSE